MLIPHFNHNMNSTLVFKRFKQVGKSVARLSDSDADDFAKAVQACFGPLSAFAGVCIAPTALGNEVTEAIVRRWLTQLPVLLPLVHQLSDKHIAHVNHPTIEAKTRAQFNERVVNVATLLGGLNPKDAAAFAEHLTECASDFFALYQACMGCEKRLIKDLASTLYMAIGTPLNHAMAARELYFHETHD